MTQEQVLKITPLLEKRSKIAHTLNMLENKVKEFTSLQISGEDGTEHTYNLSFNWKDNIKSELPTIVRNAMILHTKQALIDVDVEIEKI